MFLDGDQSALRAYHAGRRSDPRVLVYFERAGLGDLVEADGHRRSNQLALRAFD
jgi:hypothetical protein